MIDAQKNSAYNDPPHWADAGIFRPPTFDVAAYQKQIDRVVGKSPSGHSIVQLKWAWDCRKRENTKWDEFGVAVEGEWRQKYRALTIEIDNDDYVDIAPPRWILEERFEPEAIAHSWELTRYRLKIVESVPSACRKCKSYGRFVSVEELIAVFAKWDAGQVQDGKAFVHWVDTDRSEGHFLACRFCNQDTELKTVREDVWGPVPREGWYNMLPHIGIIAAHENKCCERTWNESREICYGTYKEPSGLELKRLKKAIHLRSKEAATNPHIAPELDEVALQQAKTWGLQMMRDQEVKKRNELAEMRHENRGLRLNRVYA